MYCCVYDLNETIAIYLPAYSVVMHKWYMNIAFISFFIINALHPCIMHGKVNPFYSLSEMKFILFLILAGKKMYKRSDYLLLCVRFMDRLNNKRGELWKMISMMPFLHLGKEIGAYVDWIMEFLLILQWIMWIFNRFVI